MKTVTKRFPRYWTQVTYWSLLDFDFDNALQYVIEFEEYRSKKRAVEAIPRLLAKHVNPKRLTARIYREVEYDDGSHGREMVFEQVGEEGVKPSREQYEQAKAARESARL